MLRVLNQFSHGYTFVPVAIALESRGVFTLLEGQDAMSFPDLVGKAGINPGPCRVALEMLEVMGWVRREGDRFGLTPKAKEREHIPSALLEMLSMSPVDLVGTMRGAEILVPWLGQIERGWGCDAPLSLLLDGVVLLPTLIGLAQCQGMNALLEGDASLLPAFASMRGTLVAKKWATQDEDGFTLNGVGKFMSGRAMVGGVTVSYRPLLFRMEEYLFGDADAVLQTGADGEGHIDRSLNVLSSGFQHERFFAEMDKVILSLFCGEELHAAKPTYVADMGCGDGSLLKRIHERVTSEGGNVSLIGLDYNQAALVETEKNLGELPSLLMHGDVARPDEVVTNFREMTGDDEGRVLHVRSFLDHNRPYVSPSEAPLPRPMGFGGIAIGEGGALIPAAELQQNLVEHLAGWAGIVGESGLLCLEVHAMSPQAKQDFFDLAEGFHFDALHAFSRQYLCSPQAFLAAMAEAGLFPEGLVRKQPKGMPYTRITLGHYKPKPYTIGAALGDDFKTISEAGWASEFKGLKAALESLKHDEFEGFVVKDQAGEVCGVAICEKAMCNDKEHAWSVSMKELFALDIHWRDVLMDHCKAYYSLHEGDIEFGGFEDASPSA